MEIHEDNLSARNELTIKFLFSKEI